MTDSIHKCYILSTVLDLMCFLSELVCLIRFILGFCPELGLQGVGDFTNEHQILFSGKIGI